MRGIHCVDFIWHNCNLESEAIICPNKHLQAHGKKSDMDVNNKKTTPEEKTVSFTPLLALKIWTVIEKDGLYADPFLQIEGESNTFFFIPPQTKFKGGI